MLPKCIPVPPSGMIAAVSNYKKIGMNKSLVGVNRHRYVSKRPLPRDILLMCTVWAEWELLAS